MTWFGFDKIWVIDEGDSAGMFGLNGDHLKMLILKCLNMFFIFLQSRIYESEAFTRFIKRDLKKLLGLAKTYKKSAITYRFNNWKLQKIITS